MNENNLEKYRVNVIIIYTSIVASWGADDRLSTYRMKAFGKTSSYIENRVPSGTGNPYLMMAVTIAAGLDGVINKLEPPAQRDEKTVDKMPR